jgi:phage tail protein X
MQYRCKDGDRIDSICSKHYGHLKGTVEAVLQANPEVSELPPIFSAGTLIELPTLTQATKVKTTVKLWG